MSSPLANREKSGSDQLLIDAHQKLSHHNRVGILANRISSSILAHVPPLDEDGHYSLLDVGCGDMSMADQIEGCLEGSEVTRVDVHDCSPETLAQDARWGRYVKFDGSNLPFPAGSFDAVYCSDVLHHVPEALRVDLLRSTGSVARYVVIKDHFEYGFLSRQTLRAMDWVGNYGYGVSVPERYFTRQSFEALCSQAGLTLVHCEVGIRLYDHLPIVRSLLSPRWQFLAVCKSQPSTL